MLNATSSEAASIMLHWSLFRIAANPASNIYRHKPGGNEREDDRRTF